MVGTIGTTCPTHLYRTGSGAMGEIHQCGEISKWQQCTYKVSIDIIHKTLTLRRFVLMTLVSRIQVPKVECEIGVPLSCSASVEIPSSWPGTPCVSSELIGGGIRWSSFERSDVSHLFLRWSLPVPCLLWLLPSRGNSMCRLVSRSVSWNSLCWSCFLYPKLGGIKW